MSCCFSPGLSGQSAALTSPTAGSVLTGSSATFTWSAGSGCTDYELELGSTGVGSSNLFNSGRTTATSAAVTGLPTDGVKLYARLYQLVSGVWQSTDYTNMEAGTMVPAALTTPTPSGVLTGSSVTFAWSAGSGPTDYGLELGSTGVGSSNLFNSGHTTATSAAVTGLPTGGAIVFARLYQLISGVWQSTDYTYTEAGTTVPAALTTPTPSSALTGSSVTFAWSAGSGPAEYELLLGSTGVGSANLFNSGHTTATSAAVTGLPTSGVKLYARLYQLISGVWQSTDYTYTGASTPVLNTLSCTSASMTGAGTDACVITLNAPAASGGSTVSLSSNSTAVTVPATVTVAANATSAGFNATVSPVANAQAVTLTASAGSGSKSFALQLNAAVPTLSVVSSSSPSTYGGAVTLTATISSGPTGSITFLDNGVAIGTGTINGTTAAMTTSTLAAGSHSITATWPGNSSYSATASSAMVENVNQATPPITWSTPTAITNGTALSTSQLDATSTVAGTFSYSPAVGAVLAVGSQTLSVTLTPTDSIDYTTATATVSLTVSAGTSTLSINATSVGFGNVALSSPSTQTVILSSSGTGSVTVNSAVVAGAGFTLSGPSFPATLTSGQTATLGVQFDPTVQGAATGTLTITSTSTTNSTAVIALSGTGTATSYSVALSWDAPESSTDPVAGYNIYRAPSGSSTYALLNSSVNALTTYVDSTVQAGATYDYIVESVDGSGVESAPTSPIAVPIP